MACSPLPLGITQNVRLTVRKSITVAWLRFHTQERAHLYNGLCWHPGGGHDDVPRQHGIPDSAVRDSAFAVGVLHYVECTDNTEENYRHLTFTRRSESSDCSESDSSCSSSDDSSETSDSSDYSDSSSSEEFDNGRGKRITKRSGK